MNMANTPGREAERIDTYEPVSEAERDRANADAARYRWLRGDAPEHSERWMRWCLQRWDGKCWHSLERAALDAAIDAHLKGKP